MDPQNILNGHPEGSAVELSGKLRQAFDHLLRPSSDSDEDADWDLLLPTALADRTLERIRVREDRDFAASLLDRALGEG